MKRWLTFTLSLALIALSAATAAAVEIPLTSHAALLMEKETGTVLFAQNEHEALPPASVTKIMTALLVMEAIEEGSVSPDDVVTVSAHAASMGGSQVFLSEGEEITVEELMKALCVSSGNDAAVALGEHVCGVTELFIDRMNEKAAALGMHDTHFVNCTGLTAEGHLTSAYDIALMSRELLLRYPQIRDYTTIWMDTIRNGTFGLSNTNKLIRFYDGATGLKTGYTDRAGYCISATAERDGMELIAVIMRGETADKRNEDAKTLLNYGFSAYALTDALPEEPLPTLPLTLGKEKSVPLTLPEEARFLLLEKGQRDALSHRIDLPETAQAPITAGQRLGTLTVYSGEEVLKTLPLVAAEDVAQLSWGEMARMMLRQAVFCP